jgi:hypothetical protein
MLFSTRWLPVLLLPSLLLSVVPVQAANTSRVTVRVSPIIVEDEAAPGESIKTSVNLENLSDGLLPVHSFVVNIGSKNERGDVAIISGTSASSAKDWFEFETDMIVDPKNARQVPIRINVPKDATPGGHYAAIFFNPFTTNSPSDSNVSIQSQIGVLFFLTVKGDTKQQGQISSFNVPTIAFKEPISTEVAYQNTGNVHIHPVTTLSVHSLFGTEVANIATDDQGSLTTFPGTKRVQTYLIDKKILPGIYRASISATSGKLTSTSNRWFLVIPYPFLVLLLPLIWLMVRLVWRRSRVKSR